MKKILSVTLVLTLLLGTLCIFPASAYPVNNDDVIKSGDFYYKILNDGTASIVYYEGNATHLTLPTKIDGIRITNINNAFMLPYKPNTTIKSITVPEGIWYCYIYGTPNLEELILPDSLKKFSICGLKDTKLYTNPENWEDGVFYISNRAVVVDKDKAPANLKIKDGTKYISMWACESNEKLTSLTFPDSLERIDGISFRDCQALTDINFGKNLKSIGNDAFSGCTSLKEIDLPEGLTKIEYGVFDSCGLEKVTFPSTLKHIENQAFANCVNLKSITIPESVTYLGTAFMFCENLSEIHLPKNLQFISSNAFLNTAFAKDYKNWDGEFLYYDNYLLDYSDNFKGVCVVKEGTKVVADRLFAYCDTLTSITFPDGVKGIGQLFFTDCENLESVKLPEGMDTIYESTFSGCTKLKSITIPEGVTEIDENAFLKCDSLEYVELPSTIEKIAYYSIGYRPSSTPGHENLEEMFEKSTENLVIAGYKNTVAEIYADIFGFEFVDLTSQYKEQVLRLLDLKEEKSITYYNEIYKHFPQSAENEATPDYVLIKAHTDEVRDGFAADRFGDYILRTDGHYFPATFGYLIYQPEKHEICSLEEACRMQIDGIEDAFTKGRVGELLGDVNYDRKLNIKDATLIQKAVANIAEIENNSLYVTSEDTDEKMPAFIADFNCDGKMNVRDATAIQKKLAKF